MMDITMLASQQAVHDKLLTADAKVIAPYGKLDSKLDDSLKL